MPSRDLSSAIGLLRILSITQVALLLLAGLFLKLVRYYLIRPLTSPLRFLQCPPGGTGVWGHFPNMIDYYNGDEIDDWVDTYGPTFMIRGIFYANHRLFTIDPRTIHHIMSQPNLYGKPALLRRVMSRYMKEGLLVAEGQRHRVQRKVTQKVFSSKAMRDMVDVVEVKANQLREVFQELCTDPTFSVPFAKYPPAENAPLNTRVMDVYDAASRSTYDIIGEIAIDHRFDSLGKPDGHGGDLFEKYVHMQQVVPGSQGFRQEISALYPALDKIWPTENSRRVDAALLPLDALAEAKVAERRREILEGKRSDSRDLLTLMLRTNMAKDTPEDMKLYDSEITGQLNTFLFAGSDTTAGTIAWALHRLATNPDVQDRLRAECLSYGEGLPFEQMDTLPYLNAVVMETLRMNPSIPSTIREAMKDDVIPLATPIVLRSGKTVSSIKIRKGQLVHLPIENLNMARSIWGPDARTFDPSRWLEPDSTLSGSEKSTSSRSIPREGPGVWPDIMTFIDGPRRCVGYKLALIEVKITIFNLVRAFVFSPVEGKKIYKWNLFSTRPFVGGELRTKGSSLPLLVRPYKG